MHHFRAYRSLFPALTFAVLCGCSHVRHSPLQIGYWYWNTPFSLDRHQTTLLQQAGVTQLFVRAGTLTTDGKRVKEFISQQWAGKADPFKLTLVFDFDAGLDRHFSEISQETISSDAARAIAIVCQEARSKVGSYEGIQIDADVPTRLLPKFAWVLTDLRRRLTQAGTLQPGMKFSTTALATWLRSSDYPKVAAACDYTVPQFYEGITGKDLADLQPISSPGQLSKDLGRAVRFGTPFWAGVACYGHALLFNKDGSLAATFHGFGPEKAVTNPSLAEESIGTVNSKSVEDALVMRIAQSDEDGKWVGDRIAYILPTPDMLKKQLQVVESSPSDSCVGLILYRFPANEGPMALPLETTVPILRGADVHVKVKVNFTKASEPWALMEGMQKSDKMPKSYTLRVRSIGDSPTLVSRSAARFLVLFDRRGIPDPEPGQFDSATPGSFDDGLFSPCSPANANAVLFTKAYLAPGDSLTSGTLSTDGDGATPMQVQWKVSPPDGARPITGQFDLSDKP